MGYWVRNLSATETRWVRIPYREIAESKAAAVTARATPDDWRVRLAVASDTRTLRHTVLGVRPDAADGFDRHDYGVPPRAPGATPLTVTLIEGEGETVRRLAGDFRAPGAGWRFALDVAGEPGTARISLVDPAALPPGFQVVLRDPSTGTGYDLGTTGSLVLPRRLDPAGTRYELLVGGEGYIGDEVGEVQSLPSRVSLEQNYPNPFNPSTRIVFELPAPAAVRLSVFDASGRRVAVLRDESMTAGRHEVLWDGSDAAGRPAASGVYLYRLETGGMVETRRMLLVK
jgi:hypothetical protein